MFPRPLSYGQARSYAEQWVGSASCSVLVENGHHLAMMAEASEQVGRLAGNIIHDLRSAVLMHEHGIRDILTLDRDFRTFPWVKLRPLPEV